MYIYNEEINIRTGFIQHFFLLSFLILDLHRSRDGWPYSSVDSVNILKFRYTLTKISTIWNNSNAVLGVFDAQAKILVKLTLFTFEPLNVRSSIIKTTGNTWILLYHKGYSYRPIHYSNILAAKPMGRAELTTTVYV